MKLNPKRLALIAALLLLADRGLTGCTAARAEEPAPSAYTMPASPAPTAGNSYTNNTAGGHAILADAAPARYTNVTVSKTGGAEGDSAGQDGFNAAILARNGAALTLREISVTSDGAHADAVCGLGGGTLVDIADSTVRTAAAASAGLTAADGAAVNAYNLVVHTTGDGSPALRAGQGGALNVTGGTYDAAGDASPAILAAGELSVTGAELSAGAAQGVVAEGAVTLENVTLTANGAQAVRLCQSASGEETAFTARGGSITNLRGDVFAVSGGHAVLKLTATGIVNDDPDGVLLRAGGSGDGAETRVELYTAAQTLDGDLLLDSRSALELHLWDGSVLTGAVNPTGEGEAHVELADGARWALTGDSHIDSLSCEAGSILLNGHTLTVGGEIYTGDAAAEADKP